MKGIVTFVDEGGKRVTSKISDVTSLEALGTFVTSLQSFSNAKILSYGVINNTIFGAGAFQEGAFKSVEDKAYYSFIDQTDPDDQSHRILQVPAPDDDTLEFVDGVGRRVKKAMGDALAAMMSTLTGHTIVYSRGHFQASKTQSQL